MNTWFPNPVENAIEFLSACGDDLETARGLARCQAMNADETKFMYWCDVRDALLPGKAATA